MNEALWLRAIRAVDAHGFLPRERASLTPRELAVAVAARGEERLALLVDGWYYPASYGHTRGALTEDQATQIVASLEADAPKTSSETGHMERPAQNVDRLPKPRFATCDLCGRALAPGR